MQIDETFDFDIDRQFIVNHCRYNSNFKPISPEVVFAQWLLLGILGIACFDTQHLSVSYAFIVIALGTITVFTTSMLTFCNPILYVLLRKAIGTKMRLHVTSEIIEIENGLKRTTLPLEKLAIKEDKHSLCIYTDRPVLIVPKKQLTIKAIQLFEILRQAISTLHRTMNVSKEHRTH